MVGGLGSLTAMLVRACAVIGYALEPIPPGASITYKSAGGVLLFLARNSGAYGAIGAPLPHT